MNILLTTFGTSWAIVPELLAFTNPNQVSLLDAHPEKENFRRLREENGIPEVDEVWLAATEGASVSPALEALKDWSGRVSRVSGLPRIRTFTMRGVAELASVEECLSMRELIFRLVLNAREQAGADGRCLLSLAGGRKTMSADMQLAADYFGCDCLLHVVDIGELPDWLKGRPPEAENLTGTLDGDVAAAIRPLVIRGKTEPRPLFTLPEAGCEAAAFPLSGETVDGVFRLYPSHALVERVDEVLSGAESLHQNFTRELLHGTASANFHALYTLSPRRIRNLQERRIGVDPSKKDEELAWLRNLPKVDLHCHLGGVLDPAGHFRVAEKLLPELEERMREDGGFAARVDTFRTLHAESIEQVRSRVCPDGWKSVRDEYGSEKRHLHTAAFLYYALGSADRIEEWIYGPLRDPAAFRNIGIDAYERIGDMQGSSLLQSKAALHAVGSEIVEWCRRERITYLELRCSPMNGNCAGLSPVDFVDELRRCFGPCAHTRIKLIFIASRHGNHGAIQKTIDLARVFWDREGAGMYDWFAGFDLAGAEASCSPAEVRGLFVGALQACENITIHAGEGESADNIWEAVYALNADRIGHGLTLQDRPELLQRLRQRRVALELCPSSNFQITDFALPEEVPAGDPRLYPLDSFLREGLRVTVNTDDPGISRTSASGELLRAARLTPGGLSPWTILLLIRNSMKAAFCSPEDRKKLLLDAEEVLLSPPVLWD